MIRHVPLLELPAVVAELGYEWIELSPREDFIPFFRHPRVDDATVRKFRKALDVARRRDLLGPAAVPLVRPGRGRPAGRRAVLEAVHPDRRGPRRGPTEGAGWRNGPCLAPVGHPDRVGRALPDARYRTSGFGASATRSAVWKRVLAGASFE